MLNKLLCVKAKINKFEKIYSDGTGQGPPSMYREVTTYNFSALHLSWDTWQAFGPTAQNQKSSSKKIAFDILLIFVLFLFSGL